MMSLQVKFPFGRGAGPLHSCRSCGFGTRHRVLFERHMKRCPMHNLQVSAAAPRDAPPSNETKQQLPSPPVCRNYKCDKCGFSTSKSKSFLIHRRMTHGENITIFPCDKCEYASRHKSKAIRHRHLVHKDTPEDPSFPKEMEDREMSLASDSDIGFSYSTSSGHFAPLGIPLLTSGGKLSAKSITVVQDENQNESFEIDDDMTGSFMYEDGEVSFEMSNYMMNRSGESLPGTMDALDLASANAASAELPPDPTEDAFNYIVTMTDAEGMVSYRCKLCEYSSTHKWKIAGHIRTTHMKKTLFKCPYCEFVTERKIEWCIHKTTHSDKAVHACSECNYRTTMKRNFERHLAHHQMKGPYSCTICTYSSTGEAAVQRHIAEYHPTPDKQLAIDSIHRSPEKCRQLGTVIEIPSQVLTSTPSKSGVVSSRMSPNSLSPQGQVIHCNICGLEFKSECKLRIHMIAHSSETPWLCPVCPLRYKRPADLNRHMKRKHGVKLDDYQEKSSSSPEQDQPLDLCMKKSSSDEDHDSEESESLKDPLDPDQPLDLSMKSESPESQVLYKSQDMKCSYCSYIAKWPSDLRRHMLVHSVEKRYRCQICSKKYKYQFDLNMHMRKAHRMQTGKTRVSSAAAFAVQSKSVKQNESNQSTDAGVISQVQPLKASRIKTQRSSDHPGNLPATGHERLQCPFCPYAGKYRAEVDRHMRLHTNIKPYHCMFCTYKTYWKGDMKRHLPKHHEGEVNKYGDLSELLDRTFKSEDEPETTPDRKRSLASSYEGSIPKYIKKEKGEEDKHSHHMEVEEYVADETEEKKEYTCSHCGFVCEAPSKLKCHMEIHENLKRFMCAHCGKRSNWLWDVRKHIRKDHPGLEQSVHELDEEIARASLQEYLGANRASPCKSLPGELESARDGAENVADDEASIDDPLRDYARLLDPECLGKEDLQGSWSHMIREQTPVRTTEESAAPPLPMPTSLDMLNSMSSASMVPRPSVTGPVTSVSSLIATVAAGRYRKFKCSNCGKRSNWKWDLKKHIHALHPGAHVVEMSEEDAKATFHEVLQKENEKSLKSAAGEAGSPPSRPKQSSPPPSSRFRPFKCSVCGRRSNWKWDLMKHIRASHPRAEMIVLSPEEAEATFEEEVGESTHPRGKHAANKLSPQNVTPEKTPPKSVQVSPTRSPMKLKRYMCSICPYRSDFRSDIGRHLKRRHRSNTAEVIVMDLDKAAETLPEYKSTWGARKKFVLSPEKEEELRRAQLKDPESLEAEIGNDTKEVNVSMDTMTDMLHFQQLKRKTRFGIRNQTWYCSKCSYKSGSKMAVIKHYKTHGKGTAFTCNICGDQSDYRASIFRHIKMKHNREDFDDAVTESALRSAEPKRMDIGNYDFVEDKDQKDVTGQAFIIKFFTCNSCPSATVHKHNMVRHIKDRHPQVRNPRLGFKEVEKMSRNAPSSALKKKNLKIKKVLQSSLLPSLEGIKKLKCQICPFQTVKQGLLKIHMRSHKTQPPLTKHFKCKFCPFYVCTERRLEQHMQLHLPKNEDQDDASQADSQEDSLLTMAYSTMPRLSARARFFCDKCPYVSINKNDFIYHKQFHRPKASAPFKCEHCPYWVGLRRLLTQHKKVHTTTYQELYHPNDEKHAALANSVPQSPVSVSPVPRPLNSLQSSPCKSDRSIDEVSAISHLKQKIIDSKITSVAVSSEQLKASGTFSPLDDTVMKGYVVDSEKDMVTSSIYQKLHSCRFCPYTNVRASNLRLHEKMHGRSPKKGKSLHSCAYCDYSVGNKGLLAHHVKVHSIQYKPGEDDINDIELESTEKAGEDDSTENLDTKAKDSEDKNEKDNSAAAILAEKLTLPIGSPKPLNVKQLPGKSEFYIKFDKQTGEHILEKATLKKWCCEKCPYATMKRSQFEKHLLLHGSKQKYMCEFCDYSVPGYHLLLQHKRLHLMPNPNLLSIQSIANLQKLPEVPADVAVTAKSNTTEPDAKFGIHDDMSLYENSTDFSEPKKLYRCDRCPYTNVRRDHLLSHLKFHMIHSELQCPYCDYSVTKVHLLNQHIKVHFNTPGGEMNASGEKEKHDNNNIPEFIDISELAKNIAKNKDKGKDGDDLEKCLESKTAVEQGETSAKTASAKEPSVIEDKEIKEEAMDVDNEKSEEAQPAKPTAAPGNETRWICQYCDRSFDASAKLLRHEMQHLVGTQF